MIGFVNSSKEKRTLGGEVFKKKQKMRRIYLGILGIIGFAILNFILYYLTKV